MRTIDQHNAILNEQASNIITVIMAKVKMFDPPYSWNTSYWHGYCDGIDASGKLWKLVYPQATALLAKSTDDWFNVATK